MLLELLAFLFSPPVVLLVVVLVRNGLPELPVA